MKNEVKCPICGSKNWEVDDSEEVYFEDVHILWLSCYCPNHHDFSVTKKYDLRDITIELEGEYKNEKVL